MLENIINEWVVVKKEILGSSILVDRAICDIHNKTTIVTLVLDQDHNVTSSIKEIILENTCIAKDNNGEYVLLNSSL